MKVISLFFSVILSGIAHAAVPVEGWYIGFLIGPSFASDLSFNITNPLTRSPTNGDLSYQTGLTEGGQVGYRYDKFRAEAQLVFNQNNFNEIDLNDLAITSVNNDVGLRFSGRTNAASLMLNLFYEFYKEDVEIRVVPYLGLGGGVAQVNNKLSIFYNDFELYDRDDTGYAPIGQVIAGISYFFTDHQSVALDFRYRSTPHNEALNSTIAVSSINVIANLSFD